MNLASIIDNTELKPDQPLSRYTNLCRESIENSFHSVCVNSTFVPLVSKLLNHPSNDVKVTSVIGFPLGSTALEVKLAEVNYALKNGAHELDFVIPIYSVKSKDWHHVKKEIEAIRKESEGHVIKAIIEVGLLNVDEIKEVSKIIIESGVNFLKTSSGINVKLEPAKTAEYVALLKDLTNGTRCQVKASGGISDLKACQLMIEAGASRIGTSKAKEIMTELRGELK